jgi:hypothetical protein
MGEDKAKATRTEFLLLSSKFGFNYNSTIMSLSLFSKLLFIKCVFTSYSQCLSRHKTKLDFHIFHISLRSRKREVVGYIVKLKGFAAFVFLTNK